MDCCTIANTCVLSFVASLAALCGVVVLYVKMKIREDENNQILSKKN